MIAHGFLYSSVGRDPILDLNTSLQVSLDDVSDALSLECSE